MLHFLNFECHTDNAESTTWEAMASVAPPAWPQLWREADGLLQHMAQRLPNGPAPLEDGADWDLWLALQVDDGPPLALAWPNLSSDPPVLPAPTSTVRWVSLTVTLASGAAATPLLEPWLLAD